MCCLINRQDVYLLQNSVPDPIFLMIGVPILVLQCPNGPERTAPSPGPKKRSDQIIDIVGSTISASIVISQYASGVRHAVSMLNGKTIPIFILREIIECICTNHRGNMLQELCVLYNDLYSVCNYFPKDSLLLNCGGVYIG